MKKLIAGAILAAVSWIVGAADQAVIDRYNKTCVVCHASGVANAPKLGSAEDWKPHLAKGMDKLLVSVKNGLGAMPPRGMCADCSDADYKALIAYMSTPKK
ncbi:MAG TPA: c-type cytochrome [Spongiibacteraceae bacterium]|nr:c-type cytochrome [Spongiibacteraceae bacterium]